MKINDITLTTVPIQNGLTVTYIPLPDSNVVNITCIVHGGGHNDPTDKLGIAHFMEHMAYKANGIFTTAELNKECGVRGVVSNAYTGNEFITHYMSGVYTEAEWMIRTLCTIIRTPQFLPAEIELERNVILDEFGFRANRREHAVYDNLCNVLFRDSDYRAYAVPVIGTLDCVESITRDDLLKFHASRYCASNMHLIIGGNFSIKRATDIISEELGSMPVGTRTGMPTRSEVPLHLPSEEYHPVDAVCQVLFGWALPGVSSHTGHELKSLLIDDIVETTLFNGYLSKFYNTIRENHGLCYSCYGYMDRAKHVGMCFAGGETSLKNVDKFTSLMMQEIDSMRDDTDDRKALITRAMKNLRNTILTQCDNVNSIVNQVAGVYKNTGRIFSYKDIIDSIDRHDAESLSDCITEVIGEIHDHPAKCYILNCDSCNTTLANK